MILIAMHTAALRLLPAVFLLLSIAEMSAKEFRAADPESFHRLLPQLQPGDAILLADGEWTDARLHFSAKGTALQPITLKAAIPGKTILTGSSSLRISGEHLVIEGLHFKNPETRVPDLIEFRGDSQSPAHHCRMTQCAIISHQPSEGARECRWVGLYGSHHRIDHCAFIGKIGRGTTLVVWLDEKASTPPAHQIDHNYFGPREKLGQNGGETIRIGDSQTSLLAANCLVAHNYFERCNGEVECISNKSCGNTYRHNTFFEVSGTLTLRHGNGCLVENNTFIGNHAPGSGGIRIIGEDHIVRGNHLENLAGDQARAGICFMLGIPGSPLHGYFQVKRARVENNTLLHCKQPLFIGPSNDSRATLPPIDVLVAGNLIHSPKRPVITADGDPGGITWKNNRWSGKNLGIPPVPDWQQVDSIDTRNTLEPVTRKATGPAWMPAL